MADGIGIDFGTSNSLAAIHAGRSRLVMLEHDTPVMPTATYLFAQNDAFRELSRTTDHG